MNVLIQVLHLFEDMTCLTIQENRLAQETLQIGPNFGMTSSTLFAMPVVCTNLKECWKLNSFLLSSKCYQTLLYFRKKKYFGINLAFQ